MRCPKGFKQVPAKSGNCVPNPKQKQSETPKTKKTVRSETKPKAKRCANGTRKNKKTGQCEPNLKVKVSPKVSPRVSPRVSPKVVKAVSPSPNAWQIYRINYVYPSVPALDDAKPCEFGSISIESIFLKNENKVAQINFEKNLVELSFGKTLDNTFRRIHMEDSPTDDLTLLNIDADELWNSETSDIFFSGMENDEDGYYTTKQNFDWIKDGSFGKYVKLNNVTDPNLDAANINNDIKSQIAYESIVILIKEFK